MSQKPLADSVARNIFIIALALSLGTFYFNLIHVSREMIGMVLESRRDFDGYSISVAVENNGNRQVLIDDGFGQLLIDTNNGRMSFGAIRPTSSIPILLAPGEITLISLSGSTGLR